MKNLGFLFLLVAILAIWSCGKSEDSLAPTLSSGDDIAAFGSTADATSSTSSSGGNAKADEVIDQPGVITAGEWNDINNWDFWQNLLNNKEYSDNPTYWGMNTTNGIGVLITDINNQPIIDTRVVLNHHGDRLWAAKTDNKGQAVVFPNLFESIGNL